MLTFKHFFLLNFHCLTYSALGEKISKTSTANHNSSWVNIEIVLKDIDLILLIFLLWPFLHSSYRCDVCLVAPPLQLFQVLRLLGGFIWLARPQMPKVEKRSGGSQEEGRTRSIVMMQHFGLSEFLHIILPVLVLAQPGIWDGILMLRLVPS